MIHFLLDILAGAFFCNAIPHLAAGLRGEAFPSPFAKPRGVGLSAPEVNFLWGALNLFLGLLLFSRHDWIGAALGVRGAGGLCVPPLREGQERLSVIAKPRRGCGNPSFVTIAERFEILTWGKLSFRFGMRRRMGRTLRLSRKS